MTYLGKLLLARFWTAAGVLVTTPAAAQVVSDPPVMTAVIPYEERLDVKGCSPYRGEGVLALTLTQRGRFELATEMGVLRGSIERSSRRRVLNLAFDDESLSLLAEYLRAGASAVCDVPATLREGEVRSARLRFERRRGAPAVRLELDTRGVVSREGATGRLRHRIRGRGESQLRVVPERPPPPTGGGGGAIPISPSRV